MKKNKYLFLLPVILTAVIYYYSCGDTGVNPNAFRSGIVTLSLINFKPLNSAVYGKYELWVVFDTSAGPYFRSLGTFNISLSGGIVDTAGNSVTFTLNADTANVSHARYCFITTGGNGDPNNPHLIAGSFAQYDDSAGANLLINDPNAVGTALDPLILSGNGAGYMLNQPTNNNANCRSGVWFCDTAGNSYFPGGMGLNPNSSKWIYEGWIADTSNPSNPIYRSTGRFFDPYSADMDGAGACAGGGGFYGKPGQDWVLTGGNCPPNVLDLRSGFYQVFVTLEPVGIQSSTPFFVKLFWQSLISPTLQCNRFDNLWSAHVTYNIIPKGHIQISKPRTY